MAWFCTVNSLLNDIVGILVFHHDKESTRGGQGRGKNEREIMEMKDEWGGRGRNGKKDSGIRGRK